MSKAINETLFFRGFYVELYARLYKYLNKAFRNPSWLVMSIFGRFYFIRKSVRVIAQKPSCNSCAPSQKDSGFQGFDTSDIHQTLDRDGLYPGIHLSNEILQEILEFAYTTPCYANLDPKQGFTYSEKEQVQQKMALFTAQYFNTSELCPAIHKLSKDPYLRELAALYFDAEPIFTGSRLWWNFVIDDTQPYDSNKTITFFHYDLDDYACLRFFFYLTDVGNESGPHVCVRGSHKRKSISHKLVPVKRRTDHSISNYYGADKISHITGNRGFGFAEDTSCYHKASRPFDQDRLMLQIQFAMHDYGLHNDMKDPAQLANIAESLQHA